MQDEVLAVVEASTPRRWLGVGMLATVGLLSIYVALATPPAPGWQVFLIVIGGLSLWLAQRLHQATAHRIELTEQELRSSTGEVIARVSEVEAMDRGVFAFKPSNGFLVRTREPGQRAWAPGLWWRVGRRVGIGGVTPAAQTKFMSETLAALIAERQ
ncbi:hypothetical protein FGK63_11345 [Ruegeria sediminis]|uniref:DUF2244 domain-containing protein n=1 Tax=Ruegeria sediminis TaxID=2583820 RepID=A0ABY2WYT5_9RHOB|nr:hypothetical protein [Ruegeria sediminis]TMV08034.1 hypothetical protein FGK63_11345 [Ruegeria sediminis]